MRAEDFGPRYYAVNGRPMAQMEWMRTFGNYRHIGEDYLRIRGDTFRVSTVWLGLDHNWNPKGPPLIFETMVFTEDALIYEDLMLRYSTLAQAQHGHRLMVRGLKRIVRSRKTKQLIHHGRKPSANGRPTARK